jgi:hypothetical protein
VFIGLENVNPDNLIAAKKKQNRITEYRAMLQAWKGIGAVTYCGYIIGFPHDTPEGVLRDIEIIKRELPVDLVEFFALTPLPGSEDHKILAEKGVWMDPDMNKYDAEHVCTRHPRMTDEEFQGIYRQAWDAFYTLDHIETIMRRAVASGLRSGEILKLALWFYACQHIEGVHPLQGGLFRRKYRRDRRPSLPIESPLVFYPRSAWEILSKHARFVVLALKFIRTRQRVEKNPARFDYMDLALTPAKEEDLDELEIFSSTQTGRAAAAKAKEKAHRERAKRAVAAGA